MIRLRNWPVLLGPLLLASPLALAPALGCQPEKPAKNPLEYSENARRDYERALEAFLDRDWELAELLFQEVRREYGYSRYARLAELRLADADYEQDKFAEAIGGYKGFVHDYPNDPEIVYARYRIAKAEFASGSDAILLPPLEERDLSAVNDARHTIRLFLQDYPGSKHTVELEYMLEVVTGVLARHELYVARFYLRELNFDAAVVRIEYALRELAGSGLEAEALVLLGETYLKMKRPDDAKQMFRRVLSEHADSPFTVPARRFLARLLPSPPGASAAAGKSSAP